VMEALAAHAVETRGERLGLLDSIPWGKLSIFLLVVAIALTIWGPRPRPPEKHPEGSVSGASEPASAPMVVPSSQERVAQKVAVVAAAESTSLPAAGSFSVRIQASRDSWLAISADGKPIFDALLPARMQESVQANREILVKAGNIGGLDFWFNGKKLASQGVSAEVKTLAFNASGLQPATAKAGLPAPQAAR
jgi:hypothetical protein